jgi:acetate kinase
MHGSQAHRGHVLAVNAGSSSIKFALFAAADRPERVVSGKIERVGLADSVWTIATPDGRAERKPISAATAGEALQELMARLEKLLGNNRVECVGHRIVHGGPRYHAAQRVTSDILAELRRMESFDPEHLPAEIELIEAFAKLWPSIPQVACFDTAFHAHMPRVAQILPVPRRLEQLGVRRYGFHGLSYAFLIEELARIAGAQTAGGRVILAHLGNGASMAAVYQGQSIDTTMGLTPTAGLPMSTRAGDLDPGLGWFLARGEGTSPEQFFDIVNRQSGLLGISETSSDMRDLLAARASDPRAAEAVDVFCYQARKWIGAYTAALGGLDALVFSGGIGENAGEVRARICDGLSCLGIDLDEKRNAAGATVISADASRASVFVIRTDEEIMIAKSALQVLSVPSPLAREG